MPPTKTLRASIGINDIDRTVEIIKQTQQKLSEADLPPAQKQDMDTMLADSLKQLTTGSMIERIASLNQMQKGENRLNDLMARFMERKLLNEDGGTPRTDVEVALSDATSKIITDAVTMKLAGPAQPAAPAQPTPQDRMMAPILDKIGNAVGTVLDQKLNPTNTNPAPSSQDVVTQAFYTALAGRIQGLLTLPTPAPAPDSIAQLTQVIQLINTVEQLRGKFAPPAALAPASLSEKEIELHIKKLTFDQEVKKYEIDKRFEAEIKKSESWKGIAETFGKAASTVGRSIAEVLTEKTLPIGTAPASHQIATPPPADGQQQVRQYNCPSCGQPGIYVPQGLYDQAARGVSTKVACTLCQAVHELGKQPPSPPVEPATTPG